MIPITLTCADYARVMPLATGEVKPEGIALTLVLGSRGSYGFERNRAQIDMFAGEAFKLGLTSRRVTADEYFADYLKGA